MGNDYQARYIIGLRIKTSDLFETKHRIEQCEHHHPYGNKNCDHTPAEDEFYCPKCGRPLKRIVPYEVLREKFASTGEFSGFGQGPEYYIPHDQEHSVAGWKVTVGPVDRLYTYIGFAYAESDFTRGASDKKNEVPSWKEMPFLMRRFEQDMRRVGLWDSEKFGAWCMVYLSY